jgi:hypothetical protein
MTDLAKPRKTTRVQMELAEKSAARLKNLLVDTEATSYAEVMKNALRLYEAMIERHKAGEVIMLKKPDGTMTILEIFV